MIQRQTRLKVVDNTGAKEIMCFGIPNGSHHQFARVGDIIIASVKSAAPSQQDSKGIKKGDVVRAVVVRTKQPTHRPDGSTISFDDNAAVIIDKQGEPKGTRIFGPVARELREKGYTKIVSLANEVL